MKRINMSLLALLLAIGAPIGAMNESRKETRQKKIDRIIYAIQDIDAKIEKKFQEPLFVQKWAPIPFLGFVGALTGVMLQICFDQNSKTINFRYGVGFGIAVGAAGGYVIAEQTNNRIEQDNKKERDRLMAKLVTIYQNDCTMKRARMNPEFADICIPVYNILEKYTSPSLDAFEIDNGYWHNVFDGRNRASNQKK
jgi:hypothetical protein